MINANKLFKYFFGYGVALFPLLLFVGPLISEIFLILSIIFATYSTIIEKNYKYLNNKFFIFFFNFLFDCLILNIIKFSWI